MKRITMACLSVAVVASSFGVAQAHPRLVTANPAAGARVAAPGELRLKFSEPLIGRYSQLFLADAAGRTVPLGASSLSPDRKQLIAGLRTKLAPGAYRVGWKAVSIDTHRVQASYAFTVMR
jgi:methionine-rich copper-binding protein CopC